MRRRVGWGEGPVAFETGCSHAVKFEGHERWTRVSLLLGIDGLVVDRVLVEASGRRVVHCSTGPESAGWSSTN